MANNVDDPPFDLRWNGTSIARSDWHFHRRLLERYGVILAPGEYSKIKKKIGKGRFRGLQHRRGLAIHRVYTRSAPDGFFVLCHGAHLLTAYPPFRAAKLRSAAKRKARDQSSAEAEAGNLNTVNWPDEAAADKVVTPKATGSSSEAEHHAKNAGLVKESNRAL